MARERPSYAASGVIFGGVAAVLASAFPLGAQAGTAIEVATFSRATVGQSVPEGWKPLTFKKIPKQTHYEVVQDGDRSVIKASSEWSASGLAKEVKIDPREYPIVRWRWKVENVLKNSDVTRKEGDDYPARLYITFEYDADKVGLSKKLKYKAGRAIFSDIPIAALNYIWETPTRWEPSLTMPSRILHT